MYFSGRGTLRRNGKDIPFRSSVIAPSDLHHASTSSARRPRPSFRGVLLRLGCDPLRRRSPHFSATTSPPNPRIIEAWTRRYVPPRPSLPPIHLLTAALPRRKTPKSDTSPDSRSAFHTTHLKLTYSETHPTRAHPSLFRFECDERGQPQRLSIR